MSIYNSSGPFSRKTPKDVSGRDLTNPALFEIASRLPKDDLIDPELNSIDVARGDLHNLYVSPVAGFRNTSYDVSWRTYRDLAEHSNNHILNNTFGTSSLNPVLAAEGMQKLLEHQTLMYDGLLAGMSFLESHKYALRLGPEPSVINNAIN